MGTNRITCGRFGGRNKQGKPCGVWVVDGPCTRHHDEVVEETRLARASEILDPAYPFRVPPFQRLKDKVAIYGFTAHRLQGLQLGDDFEFWGLNELYRYMPANRFHRWFEIHGREYLEKEEDGRKHTADLQTKLPGIPIYMQQRHLDIPGSVQFPVKEMCQQLGSEYFTCCPAYMVAWAIALGYSEIHVYGVDMAQETEYSYQRPCMEYWIGRAQGMGIKTHVPRESDLLTCIGVYGYDNDANEMSIMLSKRLEWLHEQDNERLALLRKLEAEYQDKSRTIKNDIERAEGALTELRLHRQTEKMRGRVEENEEHLTKLVGLSAALDGEYQSKHHALRDERNQLVGSIANAEYIQKAWLVKGEAMDSVGSPDVATRAADPALGITAPSGDGTIPKTPTAVPAH